MTTVRISSRGGVITGFTSKGHSDYADEGKDIVCAAVSVLTQTCVNALETVAGIQSDVKVGEGLLEVSIHDFENRDAQVILKSMVQGLRDVSEEYPRHVRIICSEE